MDLARDAMRSELTAALTTTADLFAFLVNRGLLDRKDLLSYAEDKDRRA